MFAVFAWTAEPFIGVFGGRSTINGEGFTLAVGDFDRDGNQTLIETLPTNGVRKLFYLKRRPIIRILGVKLNGVNLFPSDPVTGFPVYAVERSRSILTFKHAYASTDRLEVEYEYSKDLDVAVANGTTFGMPTSLYLNPGDGTFNFSEPELIGRWGRPADRYNDVASGDFDNDGYMDLLTANPFFLPPSGVNFGKNMGQSNSQLIKTGPALSMVTNIFSLSALPSYTHIGYVAANYDANNALWLDYDNDGDLDALLGWQAPYGFEILNYEQNTGRFFEAFTEQFFVGGSSWGVISASAGDFENDGDLDLLIGLDNSDIRMLVNTISTGPYVIAALKGDDGFAGRINRYVRDEFKQSKSYVNPLGDQIVSPRDVSVNSRFVYLSDERFTSPTTTIHTIKKYQKSDMKLLEYLDDVGSIPLSAAKGLDADETRLYVADTNRNRVLVLDADTLSLIQQIPISKPIDVAISSVCFFVAFDDSGPHNLIATYQKSDFMQMRIDSTYFDGIARHFGEIKSITSDDSHLYLSTKRAGVERVIKTPHDFESLSLTSVVQAEGIDIDDLYVYLANPSAMRVEKRHKSDFALISVQPSIFWTPKCVAVDIKESNDHVYLQSSYSINAPNKSLAWFDANKDGVLDFVSVGGPAGADIYIGNNTDPNNPFPTGQFMDVDNVGFSSVDVGDLNKDGTWDLMVTRRMSSGAFNDIRMSTSALTHMSWSSMSLGAPYSDVQGAKVVLADFNFDGLLDVAKSAKSPFKNLVIYKNSFVKPRKITKVSSTIKTGGIKHTLIKYFSIDENGHLVDVTGSEVHNQLK